MTTIEYIWVKEYKNIHDQGFHLNNLFDVSVDLERKTVSIISKINPTSLLKIGNISSVTVLVGPNGSGKTNLLNLIKQSFPSGRSGLVFDGFVFYLKNGKPFLSATKTYYDFEFTLDGESLTTEYVMHYFESTYKPPKTPFLNTSFIYYSNSLHGDNPSYPYNDEHDLSNKAKIGIEDTLNTLPGNWDSLDGYSKFQYAELRNGIRYLISSNKPLELPIYTPPWISFEIDNDPVRRLEILELDSLKPLMQQLRLIAGKFNQEFSHDGSFHLALFCSYLHRYYKLFSNTNQVLEFKQILDFDGSPGSETEKFFNEIVESFFVETATLDHPSSHADSAAVALSLIRAWNNLTIYRTKFGPHESLEFKLELSNIELRTFIDAYFMFVGYSHFISFHWGGLSSGEQSLLSLASRMYDLILDKGTQLRDNIFIMLDEGDVFFHPEWQRLYFTWIIQLVKNLFPNKSIQLVLATHSPILLSDIPHQNVVYLSKIEKTPIERTFGANILEIFSSPFYLSLPIGEFAKSRIQSIRDFLLQGKSISSTELIDLKNTIDLIGEPLVREILNFELNRLKVIRND